MTKANKKSRKDWVQFYFREGMNILPARLGKKVPRVAWRKYQEQFVTGKEIENWTTQGYYENIFVVLGKISNNMCEFDVDVENIELDDIFENVEEAKKKFWIAESSKGRKKIYCRGESVTDKNDQIVSNEQIGESKKGKPLFPHVEYRGNNHGSILPPSIHETGVKYKWLNINEKGELTSLPILNSIQEYNSIVERLRKKFDYKPPERATKEGAPVKGKKKRIRYCFQESHDKGDLWSGKQGHEFRVALLCELVNCNYTDNEIYDFFRTHDEIGGTEKYNQKKTEDQLQYASKKGLHKWYCVSIQKGCPDVVNKYCEICPRFKKEDTALYVSTFELPEGKYLEEILVDGVERFILYDKKTDTWEVVNDYPYGDTLIKPYQIGMNQRNAVIFPDGIEEYGTLNELTKRMLDFALEEYDPVDYPELYELNVYLALASWIAPAWQKNTAEKFIPILNARGPSETGKKRYLTVFRYLTYHSLYVLKTIRVPTLFRGIAPIYGTLILDEADMNDSSLSCELVEFLNSRADGVPIPRYSTDAKEVEYWNSFGMTILATRAGFSDDGLESRCSVMPTSTTDHPEKYHLIPTDGWLEKGKQLQRQLLLFKLRHSDGKMPTQLTIPNVSSFRVREALLLMEGLKDEDPTLLEKAKKLAIVLQERIIKERAAGAEGLILNVVYGNLIDGNTSLERDGIGYIIMMEWQKEDRLIRTPLTLRTIGKSLGDAFSASEIAKMWRGLNQDTISQKKVDSKRYRGVIQIKNITRLDKIFPKYVPNYERPAIFDNELKVKQVSLGESD